MSPQPISRSGDLTRLARDGYAIEIRHGHLLVHDVPYVNASREVRRGTLVSTLCLAGDVTQTPDTHVAYFIGDEPCDSAGQPLTQIQHSGQQQLAVDLIANWGFSSKPAEGYADYFHKMTTYINMLGSPAQQLQPEVTARTYRPIPSTDDGSVFLYIDTSTSRSQIGGISAKIAVPKIAIIGLGGTGAYVLDLLSKVEIGEIHLYDGDRYWQHNAFRAPGSTATEDLDGAPLKVDFYATRYGTMRKGVVPHPTRVDADTVAELHDMDCVFICIDDGPSRATIVDALSDSDVTFIDVGMGLEVVDDTSLLGLVRITTSVPGRREHVGARIPMYEGSDDDIYSKNIQIAELNALNATLAVIKWKKLRGFYEDTENELHSVYALDGNTIINDEVQR